MNQGINWMGTVCGIVLGGVWFAVMGIYTFWAGAMCFGLCILLCSLFVDPN